MKKSIIYSLAGLFAISSVLTSCKKGEDDPGISLKTRKSRVAGEWKMTSGTSKETQTSSNYTTTTDITYDGANATETETYTITNPSGSTTTTTNYAYTYEVTFEKDGTFSLTEVTDGITTTAEGTWNFTGGIDDKKNKSQIVMEYAKVVNDGQTYTYEGGVNFEIHYLKELRKDKIVMSTTGSMTYPDGTKSDFTQERILEPK